MPAAANKRKKGEPVLKTSGVLMHISSLPSPYGIGTLGREAMEFVDFLVSAGQSCWQILPVCPTGYGDSPYQSFSSFAGNPYFIDLRELEDAGYIERHESELIDWGGDPLNVDYGALSRNRIKVLNKAVTRMLEQKDEAFEKFCSKNSGWLDEYALFMSLKNAHGDVAWTDWIQRYRDHTSAPVMEFEAAHAQEIKLWKGIQYLFARQWHNLKDYAESKGISIIGDMPIYVAHDSVDVWAHPELFRLDDDLVPIEVSGCPPDGFAEKGQLWGNPVFDWDRIRKDGYDWWIKRMAFLTELYHILRIDHFRGFESYYAIPYGSGDAICGEWKKGPGIEFFKRMEESLGKKRIIAEDLGFLTPAVRKLLEDTGYPGMKVIELAFDHRDPVDSDYLPHKYEENCVAYLGNHDNDTIMGWLDSAPEEDVRAACEYMGIDDSTEEKNWKAMKVLWRSNAGLTIVQAQDLLGLGSEARMNTPSVSSGNWTWRVSAGAFDTKLAARIKSEMIKTGRCITD